MSLSIITGGFAARALVSLAVGTSLRVTILYNLSYVAITHLVFQVLESKRVEDIERSGWDNTIRPFITSVPISVALGMITTYFLMKVVGDPVTARYMALMLMASIVGMAFGNALANRESRSVISASSDRYQNPLVPQETK
ncbi:MAG TPA: hypothetical protein VMR37_06665 [Rhabdochlamydiaceae bacterium]|nr:hypothetical protein [Rhabdochlamydiaceae bacterium]